MAVVIVSCVQGWPISALSTALARFGVGAMPPNAMRAAVNFFTLSRYVETATKGRDVLVEPLADFVTLEVVWLVWNGEANYKFANPAILFAVGNEKVL